MSRGGAGVRAVNEGARACGGLPAGGPAHFRAHFRPISGSAFSAETAAVVRARLGGAIPEMIEAIARRGSRLREPGAPGLPAAARRRGDRRRRLLHRARRPARPVDPRHHGGVPRHRRHGGPRGPDPRRAAGRAAAGRAGGLALAVRGRRRARPARAQPRRRGHLRVPGRAGRGLRPGLRGGPRAGRGGPAAPAARRDRVRPAAPRRTRGQPRPGGRLGAARPGRGRRPRPAAAGRAPAAARRARRLDRPRAVPARAGPGRPGTAGGDRPGPERPGPARSARPAAIGPSVPLARAAMSLRWARHALALARAGVIPAGPASAATSTCPRC